MTVKELIEKLEKLDQSRIINMMCYEQEDNGYDKIFISGVYSSTNEDNVHIYVIY